MVLSYLLHIFQVKFLYSQVPNLILKASVLQNGNILKYDLCNLPMDTINTNEIYQISRGLKLYAN